VRRPAEELAVLRDWHNKERWLRKGKELEYTDVSGETQTELVPTKEWTAWPLPPSKMLSTQVEDRQASYGMEPLEWSIGGSRTQDAGEELREELLATFLRLAKDRWNGRESADETDAEDHRTTSRSRSRSKSIRSIRSMRSHRSVSTIDVRMKDGDDHETDNAETHDEDEEKSGHIIGRKRGRKPRIETYTGPMFLADEAKALRTLQPTINSVLTRLDSLALAVRRTRLNHFGRGSYSDKSSQSDFTSGAESVGPISRASSRAASRKAQSRNISVRPTSRASSVQHRHASAKSGFTHHKMLFNSDSDSDSQSLSGDDDDRPPSSEKRPRSRSNADGRSSSAGRDETWRAGLMDWSEVLGLAAVQGWNDKVIARTAQRCAALFGESISFIPLNEELATKPVTHPVQYTPATIPAPDMLSIRRSIPSKRPLFQAGTLRCPHVGCYGHEKDFEAPYRVVEHCMRVHDYDPRTNDSDNEDRTLGGVHIDGFLQPIAAQRGRSGRGKSRAGSEREKQMVDSEGDDLSAAEAVTIDSD
jgi:N-terminal acetyltransferase B complex catalytic subunit